jgi:acylphosphatase
MTAEGDRASRDGSSAAAEGGPGRQSFEPDVARHLVIDGLVQGVFYRYSMRQVAISLAVSGWVRNRHDGSVEAFVQGRPERVEQLIAWCREGPGGARVERVEVEGAAPDPRLTGFGIR